MSHGSKIVPEALALKFIEYMGKPGAAQNIADCYRWKFLQRWQAPLRGKHIKMYVGNLKCNMCEGGTLRMRLDFKTGEVFGACTTDKCFKVKR